MIRAAIASAREVVDEVIVVDTGSTDGTPELARREGARVFVEPWPGDLAAAHALPVARARGDWILALDADEVLGPVAQSTLRTIVRDGGHEAYRLPVRNYVYDWSTKWRVADPADPLARGAPGYRPTTPVRLFRRRREYDYSGLVHQTVAPAIRAAGGTIGPAAVPIHHYGFLRADRAKSELYGTLLRRQVCGNPDDPGGLIDLGSALLDEGRAPAAAAAFRRALTVGDRAAAPFLLGTVLAQCGAPERAIDLLQTAIAGNRLDESPYYDRADAWEELGLAHEALGRPDAAERAYRAALSCRPDSPVAALNLAGLLADGGAHDEAATLVDDLLSRYPWSAKSWTARGVVRLRQRDLPGAQRALETALDIRAGGLASLLTLARTHQCAGHLRKAARAYRAAAEGLGTPDATEIGLERHLAPRYLPIPSRLARRPPPGLVVSVIDTIAGDAGRVLVHVTRALHGRPHAVLCRGTGLGGDRALRAELEASGCEILTVGSEHGLRAALAALRPAVVVHHWWQQDLVAGAARVGDERWICVGHAPLPMPPGYDRYVVSSRFHARFQAHLPPARVSAVPNAVDTSRFTVARPHEGHSVTIVMLSRLEPGRFPRRLLDHLPPLDGARLLVAGSGPRRQELEPEVVARGLARRVRFLGPVPPKAIPQLLADADIGLHVTELHEDLSCLAVLEMLAAGLPIVTEAKGGLPEMVTHGGNGFVARDPPAAARHLQELIASPLLRQRMGEVSRRVAARFDLAGFTASWGQLVEDTERRRPLPWPVSGKPPRSSETVPAEDLPRLAYLVCATPGSGNTLLCAALTASGVAGDPGEPFSALHLRTVGARWGSRDFGSYLAQVLRTTTTPNGVFGATVLPDGFAQLLAGLRTLPSLAGLPPSVLVATALPGVRYVHLTRHDRLRQAVSLELAAQTERGTDQRSPPSIRGPRPNFDRAALAQRARDLERSEARWQRFFRSSDVEPIRAKYEDIVDDPAGAARGVLEQLGIDPPNEHLACPAPLPEPDADGLTEEWVQRFLTEANRP